MEEDTKKIWNQLEDEEQSELPNYVSDDGNLNASKKCCKSAKQLCFPLFVGQLLAGLLGGSGVCAALLSREGFNLPLTQNIPHYLLLFLVFGSVRLIQRRIHSARDRPTIATSHESKTWQRQWWPVFCYLIAGCIDLHSFWATLAAYAYTNVTSIQLLDCLAIPTSMLLSYFLLRYRYSWTHYVGAGICLIGAMMMIGADVLAASRTTEMTAMQNASVSYSWSHVIVGDLLAVVGATLYGMSSVLQEHLTNQWGALSYLTWFSLVAAVFAATYTAILERASLTELIYTGKLHGKPIPLIALAYYFGYTLCMFTLDATMAFAIGKISAVFINLSLLTADLYGLLAGIWLFHLQFHYLYFASFVLILIGATMFAARNAKSQAIEPI